MLRKIDQKMSLVVTLHGANIGSCVTHFLLSLVPSLKCNHVVIFTTVFGRVRSLKGSAKIG